MKTIVYETNPLIDKSKWPAGEWDREPDKVQFEDKLTGYPCLAVRNRMGAWCGYVGVANDHRFYGKHYDDVYLVDERLEEAERDDYPPAHGGLTFASRCLEGPEDETVCHVPEEGESDDVWWLGFDCLHGGDAAPGMMMVQALVEEKMTEEQRKEREQYSYLRYETYKPLGYVQDQCKELASWLKAAA